MGRDLITVREFYEDKYWRMQNLYYILNENGKKVKFVFNHLQELLWKNYWYLNIVLKARQFGGTTWIDLFYLDDCLFIRNIEAGIIAHNRGDAQKIFRRKVRYPFDQLPEGFRNAMEPQTKSAQELSFPNDSTIYVATSIRSGTAQRLHISEHAKICKKYPVKAEEIKAGSLNAVHSGNIIFIESTAEGSTGDFYDFCQIARENTESGKQLTKLDWRFHFFPWYWDDKNQLSDEDTKLVIIPVEYEKYFDRLILDGVEDYNGNKLTRFTGNQKAWYIKKDAQMGDKMWQEFPSTPEEAFNAPIKGAYYKKQMFDCAKENRIDVVPYDPALLVNTGWDLGVNDQTEIIFHQEHRGVHRIIDYYHNNKHGLKHYVKVLKDKEYIYGNHYLPHDIEVMELGTGRKRIDTLQKMLPKERFIVVPRTENIADDIDEVRMFLPICWFDKAKTTRLVTALKEYRKEWDESHGVYKDHPYHDWTADPEAAMRSLVRGLTIAGGPSKAGFKPRRR